MTVVKPRTPAPALEVETLAGDDWSLAEQRPERFTMIVFYRGLHCPICKTYLRDLDRQLGEFRSLGVDVIAISTDDRARAGRSRDEWRLDNVRIGYGLTIESAREWGLFISTSIKEQEPPMFSEPGLFLIKPDGEIYYEVLNSVPFSRPRFDDILKNLNWAIDNDYPARGEA